MLLLVSVLDFVFLFMNLVGFEGVTWTGCSRMGRVLLLKN